MFEILLTIVLIDIIILLTGMAIIGIVIGCAIIKGLYDDYKSQS
jgi:hypothetical protein